MHAAADASQADDLAVILTAINELLSVLGMGRDAIDLDDVFYQTGIPVDRIHAVLNGEEAEPEDLQEVFKQRLVFLRETRLKPGGKRYTLDEIAAGAGISHGQVGYLLSGDRKPGFTVLAGLERFFDVPPGFFTATERQALHRSLKPVHESLTHVALLKGKGISQLALRSSIAHGTSSSRLGQELRTALETALSQPEPEPEDPEVRELADKMLSLPAKSRRRVIPLIKDLLGLMRPEGESPTDSPAQ
ncbi:XRE family transcriptional regulator [Streptomyces dangxiongensis]|uniref:XRE family transcriptional regulator n=1 Tax=Streptomyces dangxiongensis TaxID=1442032 RepID=A0A3G2JGR5_9ACTN|nr:helix-turn-helix transcriptional regulator [Streptomyces dangxiongensis]AYN41608.1 XRE family transcriptional regulator [Streptomyces dangxiongensis]